MRQFLAALSLAFVCSLAVADGIPKTEYSERRAKLQKSVDGVVVLFGRAQGSDEVFREFQDTSFLYFTGVEEAGGVMLVTPKEEILFLPKRNERMEKFTGPKLGPNDPDVKTRTGFADVQPLERFESRLQKAAEDYYTIYAFTNHPTAAKIKNLMPLRELADASRPISKLRMKKSAAEIAAIQRATDVTIHAQMAAWHKLQPGAYEYQAGAAFVGSLMEQGCERVAYAPIVGSGPNSTILHYNASTRRMDRGEVVVLDAAAECGGYTSDITRTIPVGGKFSGRQKEIYSVVLGAQNAAMAAAKPGVSMADLNKIAKKYMEDNGGYGKYFIHGLGHPVGLDVHDLGDSGPLEAGDVVTIEPGIYIPEEGIGVRIEDVIVITDDGMRLMSAALPREISDVERTMAKDAVVR
jgi:Xaa-Pro aminopeptidase